ncbi:ATP-grasp domain-containing protein [Henriciella aquimarina]|uniref:ATP-grasp domain-containing protein n=1 Tax=Henriciella aquimarina TaxID=545261 RepID=UPI001F3B275B|nr:hypothetical protein [Henriciella aquimarina]
MMDLLRTGFSRHGASIEAIAWDDPAADWASYDAALIGTTWDYWDRVDAFLETLSTIGSQTQLHNPADLVSWNIRKTYLRDLEARGARLIPTLWLDRVDEAAVSAAFDTLGSDDLVFKRQIAGGAFGQHRLKRGEPIPAMPHPMMVQPFLPMIEQEGELSFIFIDGALSHALLKRAAPGDYRIQSLYGGTETAIEPSPGDVSAAQAVLETLDETPLYARVDMLREQSGALLLMELELIEPYLYPEQGPELGNRLADALMARL